MNTVVIAVYSFLLLILVVQEWLIPISNRVKQIEEELVVLNKRYIGLREDIKKIKGQFIWSDEESEVEE